MNDYRLLFLGALALWACSCGRWASAHDQTVETLAIPKYPKVSDDVFSLSSRKPDTTYRATMLFIHEGADPMLLGEVLNASVYSREVFANARRFELVNDYKNLYSDTGLEPQTVTLMKKDLNTFELSQLQKNPMTIEERKTKIKDWFDQKVGSLPFDAAQRRSFDDAWGAYCEAKIVELASNSVFAASSYKELPTPQGLCSDYYASAGLLAGASCQNPKEGNYFTCLWQEGVGKTRWFQASAELTAEASSAMAQKKSQLQELLKVPSNFQKVLALDPTMVSINSNPVKNKITPNFFTSIFTQQLVKEPGNNVAWCSVPPFGIKDRKLSGICTLFGLAPLEHSPAEWINSLEGRSSENELFTIPPPTDVTLARFEDFVRYLGERDKGRSSEGDRLFHAPLQSPKPLVAPIFNDAGEEFLDRLDSVKAELSSVIYGSLDETALAEKDFRSKNISYREAKIAEMQDESKVLEAETERALSRGLKATNAPGVAHAFVEIRFHFRQVGSILVGEFWPKDAEVGNQAAGLFRGCFDLSQQETIDCPAELASGDSSDIRVFPAQLNRDPETGQINLAMKVEDPDAASLILKPRMEVEPGETPNYFMDLDSSAFKGRQLRFELFPNRLQDSLDILTGKVFLEDETRAVFEGGISGWELWD